MVVHAQLLSFKNDLSTALESYSGVMDDKASRGVDKSEALCRVYNCLNEHGCDASQPYQVAALEVLNEGPFCRNPNLEAVAERIRFFCKPRVYNAHSPFKIFQTRFSHLSQPFILKEMEEPGNIIDLLNDIKTYSIAFMDLGAVLYQSDQPESRSWAFSAVMGGIGLLSVELFSNLYKSYIYEL